MSIRNGWLGAFRVVLMIKCPSTGRESLTGIDTDQVTFDGLPGRPFSHSRARLRSAARAFVVETGGASWLNGRFGEPSSINRTGS